MIAYTVAFGRTDLLEPQTRLISKFCDDITELRIVNNGPDFGAIEAECKRLRLTFVNCPPTGAITHHSHANALNLAWDTWAAWEDHDALILDQDVFPFRSVSPSLWLRDAEVAANFWNDSGRYPWVALLAISRSAPRRESIRFTPLHVQGHFWNTGSAIGYWMARHPSVRTRSLLVRPTLSGNAICEESWLHLVDSSNWSGKSPEICAERTNRLHAILQRSLAGEFSQEVPA